MTDQIFNATRQLSHIEAARVYGGGGGGGCNFLYMA